jgi:hypothetical protein
MADNEMTLKDALEIILDLALENMLSYEELDVDSDDALQAEYIRQHKASEMVAKYVANLDKD